MEHLNYNSDASLLSPSKNPGPPSPANAFYVYIKMSMGKN